MTLAVLIREGKEEFAKNVKYFILIMLSQLFGAFLGVCLVRASMSTIVGADGTTRVADSHFLLLCP